MKVLIVCFELETFTGSPLYNYTMAMEMLRRGDSVSIFTTRWKDNELRENLIKAGCHVVDVLSEKYDLAFISQPLHDSWLSQIKADRIINIIHSEYHWETPIIDGRIKGYIAIRESIKTHLIEAHKIDKNKIAVIYNGINLERFSPKNRVIQEESFVKVIMPCTIDPLRNNFIDYYVNRANQKLRVYIYGTNWDNREISNPWVYLNEEIFNIEDKIKDADIVAGILLGRVNLEARAMGIPSVIHNPDNPEEKEYYFPDWDEFRNRHDIKQVVEKIYEFCKTVG